MKGKRKKGGEQRDSNENGHALGLGGKTDRKKTTGAANRVLPKVLLLVPM